MFLEPHRKVMMEKIEKTKRTTNRIVVVGMDENRRRVCMLDT